MGWRTRLVRTAALLGASALAGPALAQAAEHQGWDPAVVAMAIDQYMANRYVRVAGTVAAAGEAASGMVPGCALAVKLLGAYLAGQLAEALRCGEKVLVFPEGTRTNGLVLNPLNKGYALAALRSQVPVQLIGIRVNTPILSKRQHFLKSARWPVTFRLEMGPTIEPGEFQTVHQMNSFVESWFRQHLASTAQSAKSYLPAKVESSESDGVITTHFRVPVDPFYCRGHMPGNPIVPAYAQMAWIHEILQQRFSSPISRIEYTRMKFIQTVLPGNDIEILIQLDGADGRISINKSSEKVSQGRVHVHCEGDEK